MNSVVEEWKAQRVTLTPNERAEPADFLLLTLEPPDKDIEAAWKAPYVSASRGVESPGDCPGPQAVSRAQRA